jgi:hypothetical protein
MTGWSQEPQKSLVMEWKKWRKERDWVMKEEEMKKITAIKKDKEKINLRKNVKC